MSIRPAAEQQLVRQWRVLQDLAAAGPGCTIAELARRHGVSKATLQRDVDTLALVFRVDQVPDPRHSQRRLWRAAIADAAAEPRLEEERAA